jgi:hypothetical protein
MRWFSRSDAMTTTASEGVKKQDRVRVNIGNDEEIEMFRATLDLREKRHGDVVPDTVMVESQEPPAATCAKTFCSKMMNSPVARTALLLVILGILMYLVDRLGGNAEQQETVRAAIRSVFKAVVAPVYERNVTTASPIDKN